MNKAIQKMMLALAVCGVMCTTAMAAPKGQNRRNDRGRTEMRTSFSGKRATPAKRVEKAPARKTTKVTHVNHKVVHHHVTKPVRRPAPPPPPRHHHDHCDNNGGVVTFATSLVTGLIGGLIGAAL